MKFLLLILPVVRIAAAQNSTSCKVTPSDAQWPSPQDWATFNATVNGALIKTAPIASTCFRNNPFNIKTQCADVTEQWENATFHRMLPESIDFPIFTNRACVPSSKTGGSTLGGACTVGAYPAYVVKATNVVQIATALTWASQKNIRVVIKGTGHDLSGRYAARSLLLCRLTRFPVPPAPIPSLSGPIPFKASYTIISGSPMDRLPTQHTRR